MIDFRWTWCLATEENYKALEKIECLDLRGLRSAHNKGVNVYYIIDESLYTYVINSPMREFLIGNRQIHLVDGEFKYVEIKPKNNFKEYGFEADFEGEILGKSDENEYVGFYVYDNIKTANIWGEDGESSYQDAKVFMEKFKLTPIKKEWYKNPDNFPCLVIYDDKEIKLMGSYSETSKFRTEPCLLTAEGWVYYSLSKCRLATEEEALKLVKKG